MMIQTLSNRFRRSIAVVLYLVFYGQILGSLRVMAAGHEVNRSYYDESSAAASGGVRGGDTARVRPAVMADSTGHGFAGRRPEGIAGIEGTAMPAAGIAMPAAGIAMPAAGIAMPAGQRMGGPNKPEAGSFKTVNADNLVNLFTGDFSYSIPLLDVGGYPVNIFYNGGITMDQEASWVGLGWNINPGSVSRNMRGVPDDFDGTDTLVQRQNVKPNETWGGTIGADAELLGIKAPNVGLNLGFSWNNYLGPAMDLGADVSVSVPIIQSTLDVEQAPEDSTQGLSLNFGLNAKLSSRSGLTLAPSLNANMHWVTTRTNEGIGLTTSYNSRTGIQSLNLTSQFSSYWYTAASTTDPDAKRNTTTLQGDLTTTSITFARPSYTPTLRMPMEYDNYSGQLEFGAGMFGLRGALTGQGYYSKSYVAPGCTTIYKPLVGYIYLQNARQHSDAVMDFNRVNDGPVTPNTPIIAAPQYDYDIFTIQGEGTGGSIRAYRNDMGFMRDNLTTSRDKNISVGVDLAPPGHFGGNVNTVHSPTMSGGWDDGNNTLNYTLQWMDPTNNSSFENVYFRNPGEATVTNNTLINKIGQDNLVRFLIDGTPNTPTLESKLEQFSKNTDMPMGTISMTGANTVGNPAPPRDKRTQVVTMLTATEAAAVGLDDSLRSYNSTLDANHNLTYSKISRAGGYRKGHHISEITVLESNGMRYVYGLPVYNTLQQDFTFSVRKPGSDTTNLVGYGSDEPTPNSQEITSDNGIDGYMSMQQTPAYASSFLITGLLSPDYVDVTGNGITEDDLGNAVKFDYAMSSGLHKWRTPRTDTTTASAHFNIGLKTERRDDKGVISYGTREAWYLHAVESKTMIAIFSTSSRNDDKGVMDSLNGEVNSLENVNLKLDSISLYTKAEIKAYGLPGAVPIKTVHFDYSYTLCQHTPDNPSGGGKLTLNDIYFTFNGQSRVSKDMYVFNYGDTTHNYDNARYNTASADRWGIYKPMFDSMYHPVNPGGLNNIDYPYTSTNKAADDQYAGEWSLKKILLPSAGQIEVSYEADDYAYVQDRRSCNMYNIYGFGVTTAFTNSNNLYLPFANTDQNYVYVQLPTALVNVGNPTAARQEIYAKYLETLNQLAFKLNINMPKGMETLTAYANITDYGLCSNDINGTMIYIELTPVSNGAGPLANSSVQFLINNLPGQAFPGYDMSGVSGVTAFIDMLGSMLSGLWNAFSDAVDQVRSQGLGSTVSLASSFVRLGCPTFFKYGGGHRVKRVVLKDNWNAMTGQYASQYGQDYCYTTTQDVNGVPTTISSGVASYEPGIGSEENPFREILSFENQLPLASAQYGAIEMPVLEAFYPAPVVGYSKVTVKSINRNGKHGDSIVRSAIGSQVSEFYTAKDYPSFWTYTPMNNIDYHHAPAFTFFNKETIDRRVTSQGFLVETNDMHGKMKSQTVYSESDPKTPLSYTIHYYKNTGANGLDDLVNFVNYKQGGTVTSGNMGVDMELMTDVREFSEMSTGNDLQAQVDFFTFVPWPIPGVFAYPLSSYTENTYKAVTTTKLINYHAIEDSVVVDDKGSVVTTKTLAYDAETGMPVVTQTANEFNDPIYNISYPAYWAYSGMAPAYSNIGMSFTGVTFNGGQLVSGAPDSVFESGDELYITTAPSGQPGCAPASSAVKIWVYDTSKNSTALTVPSANRSLMFIDTAGQPYTGSGVGFMIVRSGHRNDLGQTVGTVTAMTNPIHVFSGVSQLVADSSDSVVSASASAFNEKWQVDPDEVPTTIFAKEGCVYVEVPSCTGTLPTHLNPYVKGLIGNFKPYRNYVYYGTRVDTNVAVDTRIRHNGYIRGFGSYWGFNSYDNLVPDNTNTHWLWNTQITRINSKGQELETEDALGRYTAAQYGYAKNFPVAVTQNATYGQSFYAGFEDNNYNETLNNVIPDTCNNAQYINFTGSGGSLINTADSAWAAHTGQYVLGLAQYSTSSITVPVVDSNHWVYQLAFGSDTTKMFNNPGIDTSTQVNFPSGALTSENFSPGYSGLTSVQSDFMVQSNSSGNYFLFAWNGYIKITSPGTYTFNLSMSTAYNTSGIIALGNNFGLTILDSANNVVVNNFNISTSTVGSNGDSSASLSIYLCPGKYQLQGAGNEHYTGTDYSHNFYLFQCPSCNSQIYKNLNTVDGCVSTAPIAASSNMLNPDFSLQAGQKMQFSTWVREDCGNKIPCYDTSYTHDHVTLQFPGSGQLPSVTFRPSGTIIDGWQKIEGVFTVPTDASTCNFSLSSDSVFKTYFDDMRLHPFSADMKTYVYDPQSLRLMAEMDENNYATIYNYDEEGQLVRVKKETIQGIKTIKETRTAKQKVITNVQ